MFASLAGLIALAILVYKYVESSAETHRLTKANREYEVENGRLRTQLGGKKANDTHAGDVVAGLEASLESRTRDLTKAEEEIALLNKKLIAAQESEKLLRKEKDQAHLDAKRALASVEDASKAEKALALAEKEREEVFQKLQAAEMEVEALRREKGEAVEATAALEAVVASLKAQNAVIEAAKHESEGRVTELKEKVAKLEKFSEAAAEAADAAADAQGQLQIVTQELEQVRKTKTDAEEKLRDAEKRTAEAAKDLEVATSKAAELEAKLAASAALEGEVAELKGKNEELEAAAIEAKEKSAVLEAEVEALKTTSVNNNGGDSIVNELESKVADLEKRLVEADVSYSNAAAERAQAKAKLAEVESDTAKKVAMLESQVEDAKAAMSAAVEERERASAGNNDELEEKIDVLNARVANLEQELTTAQLTEEVIREEKDAAEQKVEQLKNLNAQLMCRLKTAMTPSA